MKTIEQIYDFLKELSDKVEVNDYIHNYVDVEELQEMDGSDAWNYIYDNVKDSGNLDIEIIYYSNAIEYLKENDPSLKESLEIAHELGYMVDNLNSEILASLLATRKTEEEFMELQYEVEEFFNN